MLSAPGGGPGTQRPRLPGNPALPQDVRRRAEGGAGSAVVVEAVLDALPSPTLLVDAEGRVLLANTAWEQAADLLDDDRLRLGLGGDYLALVTEVSGDPHTAATVVDQLRALSRGECPSVAADYAVRHPCGTRWYHLQASRVDQAGQVVVTHTDVTARVLAERASAWRARHDTLTELPNRAHLHELIDAELRRPGRGPVCVLFLDIDGFKDVNDSLGHDAGDELLRQVATRLTGSTRAGDTVGRLGGDEFVVLSRDCDIAGAEVLADRFRAGIAEPFDLGGRAVRLGVSIGIATAGEPAGPGLRSTDLVHDADLAMYAAKAAGRNRVRLFTADLRAAAHRRAALAGELREALAGGQLVLHYQPIVRLGTGRCGGAEALVRWQHPVRGLLPPADFVPLAERYELIGPLTRWVLAAATRQAAAWYRAGRPLVVGVNVSDAHLSAGTLVGDVAEALRGADLPPEWLLVELTESCVVADPAGAAAQLAALRRSGVEVSVDDVGSGLSSLGRLVVLPAGVLKIDRSLVAAASGPGESAAAIAAVVGLARALGMRSLVEGVETAEQLAVATALGCTFAQGHHLAPAMPAGELTAWLGDRDRLNPARRAPSGG